MAVKEKADFISTGLAAHNRRSRLDYFINEKFVAGLELSGRKSNRCGWDMLINDAFGVEKPRELYISNMFIADYANSATGARVEKRVAAIVAETARDQRIISALAKKGRRW